MKAFWWSWLAVFSTATMFTLCAAQDAPQPPAGKGMSQPFTRTAAPDPSLPPVSMLVRLLSMTPEQEQKVRQLFAAHNQRYGEILQQNLPPKERQEKLRELRRNLQKSLEGALTPQQLQKLRNLQPEAMLVDRLTVALRLTQEQSEQLLAVLREQSTGIRAIEKEAEEKKWSEQQRKEKLADLRKQIDEKVKKILTPEQQQKLKQILQGEGTPAQAPSGNQQPPAP